jgi:hypothetical protein
MKEIFPFLEDSKLIASPKKSSITPNFIEKNENIGSTFPIQSPIRSISDSDITHFMSSSYSSNTTDIKNFSKNKSSLSFHSKFLSLFSKQVPLNFYSSVWFSVHPAVLISISSSLTSFLSFIKQRNEFNFSSSYSASHFLKLCRNNYGDTNIENVLCYCFN